MQGLRDTSGFVANEAPENWRQGLLLLYPNSAKAAKAPLTALTSLLKERSVDDPRFHWWEKELDDRRFSLHATAAYAGGDIAASAAGSVEIWNLAAGNNAKTLVQNDLLRVEHTGEIVRVYSDPTSDTQITVVRGDCGSTPAAVDPNGANVNPNLIVIGTAFEEGSLPPTGVNYDPTEYYNYTQIFRRTFEITRTASKTKLRTVEAVTEAKRECLEYISIDMERALLLGKRSTGTQNGRPRRTTAGVINQIDSSNIYSFTSGSVQMSVLEEQMYTLFKYGSSEKMGLCGNRALLAIGQCVRKNSAAQWMIKEGVKEFGMSVTKLTCPFGEMTFKSHPLMTQAAGGTNAGASAYYGMDSWSFNLDMDDITYTYLTDSDLDYEADLQANGMDGMQSGYLAECGLELHFGKAHSLWKQMQTGAADS